MAIVIEDHAFTHTGSNYPSSLALPSVSVPDEPGTVAMVFAFNGDQKNITSVTRSGGGMTEEFTKAGTSVYMEFWIEVEPPSGNITYTASWSGGNDLSAMIIVLSGVDPKSPFRDTSGVTCECASQSRALTTVHGDLLIGSAAHSFNTSETYMPTSPAVELIDAAGANGGNHGSDKHHVFMCYQEADPIGDTSTNIAYTKSGGSRRTVLVATAARPITQTASAPIFFYFQNWKRKHGILRPPQYSGNAKSQLAGI